ncbi:MAG: M48 family metalloprotease [Candidatus Micrarchaeota archaeon]|nr:M48 family metalloprotease [Candidatus Micrarchaeota archaeon]
MIFRKKIDHEQLITMMPPELIGALRHAHDDLKAYDERKRAFEAELRMVAEEVGERIGVRVPEEVSVKESIQASVRLGQFWWDPESVKFDYGIKEIYTKKECEAIMGHELGHFKSKLINRVHNKIVGAIILLPSMNNVILENYYLDGVKSISILDRVYMSAVTLIGSVFVCTTFVAMPVGNFLSRKREKMADVEMLKTSGLETAVRALVKVNPTYGLNFLEFLFNGKNMNRIERIEAEQYFKSMERSFKGSTHPSVIDRIKNVLEFAEKHPDTSFRSPYDHDAEQVFGKP